MTKILTGSFNSPTFTPVLQSLAAHVGKLLRLLAALPETRKLNERFRFDMGETDVDPLRDRSRHCTAGGDFDMMRLRSI